MNESKLKALLKRHKAGRASTASVVDALRHMPFEDLDFARVDHHRELRTGMAEVVYCQGKSPAQIRAIAKRILAKSGRLLATRADRRAARAIPRGVYHEAARCVTVGAMEPSGGRVLVVSAGTADMPVAEEARVTAAFAGARVESMYDVGVAGLHRLLAHSRKLQEADALVVVAGMEGALASVVAGMVRRPVVAVPTSVGYGASFRGIAPLLTMLNSCAAGVAVVNIDNGFGAGYLAALIAR